MTGTFSTLQASKPTSNARLPIRIGMIGMGAIAIDHLARIEHNPLAKVIAVCDPSEQSLSRSRAKYGKLLSDATSYGDFRDLLKFERPDAVIICSPHRDHFDQVSESLALGAHVLVEKPLVNKTSQAQRILELAAAANVVVGIAYQRHTMSHFRYIHDTIQSGRLGKVQSVTAYQQEGWKNVTVGTWRHKPEISGGGYLHDGGSHLVDLVLWSTGLKPVAVTAFQDKLDVPVDVNTVMNIRFEGGALGTLSIMGDTPGWCQRLVIGCERGAISYSDEAGVVIQHADRTLTRVPHDDMPPSTDVVTNFLNAIAHDEPILAPLECGLAVMRLTEAVVDSATHNGSPIKID